MAYYAAELKLSTDYFDGSVEITKEQYGAALEALTAGKFITVINGELVIMDEQPTAPTSVSENILSTPSDLFGGPTLGDLYHGN